MAALQSKSVAACAGVQQQRLAAPCVRPQAGQRVYASCFASSASLRAACGQPVVA
ncbi:hypothetical protein MNEG_7900, partial [Monoraphidium neglectum]